MSIDFAPRVQSPTAFDEGVREERLLNQDTPSLSSERYVVMAEMTTSPVAADAARRMRAMLDWPADWDGHGAARINFSCAWALFDFLKRGGARIAPVSLIFGTPEGGVVSVWRSGAQCVEMTFDPNASPRLYFSDERLMIEWEGAAADAPREVWRPLKRVD